jgi:hypothetical protein
MVLGAIVFKKVHQFFPKVFDCSQLKTYQVFIEGLEKMHRPPLSASV